MARRSLKLTVLAALRAVGAFEVCVRLPWRRRRLLILGYHGVSLADEHEWEPSLYHSPRSLEARLGLLQRDRYNVLPLAEAVEALYAGTLPPRSVVLTFDDGTVDFKEMAHPLLQRYGFPATVYLTTHYCEFDGPVFNVFARYLLWKAARAEVDASPLLGRPERWHLGSAGGQVAAFRSLIQHVRAEGMCSRQKDEYLFRLGDLIEVDQAPFRARRMFRILRPKEVTDLGRQGVDFQLHTHRHRTPSERGLFLKEIEDNRRVIEGLRSGSADHLAYPAGVHSPEFLPWLKEGRVATATTAEPDLATRRADRLRLPRVMDVDDMSLLEFHAWLSGVRSFFPSRARYARIA